MVNVQFVPLEAKVILTMLLPALYVQKEGQPPRKAVQVAPSVMVGNICFSCAKLKFMLNLLEISLFLHLVDCKEYN